MTIRSSSQAIQNQQWRRGQTLCTLFRVTRNDGVVLRWTDHDRTITVEGEVYTAALLGSLSAERREPDLRASNQEAVGVIDGTTLQIPDLLGNKYRGAKVEMSVVDWRRPWVWHYRATKRVKMMTYDGSRWTALLEGLTQQLQAPVGGRFTGMHSQTCTYTLGDLQTCKAHILDDLIYNETAFVVPVGVGSLTTTIEIENLAGGWTTNQWVGYKFHMRNSAQRGEERNVVANTANVLTLDKPLSGTTSGLWNGWVGRGPRVATVTKQRMEFTLNAADFPTAGNYSDNYFRDGEVEWMTGNNAGTISPIIEYRAGTRTIVLLLPTPFDIAANDRCIMRPGCDGLISTCANKFRSQPFEESGVSAATTTSITAASPALAMTANQYANAGYFVRFVTGAYAGQERAITANTATGLTWATPLAGVPTAATQFRVVRNNVWNFGGTDVYAPGSARMLQQIQ